MANYIYAIWFGAKTVELLSLGQIGSNLAHTASKAKSFFCRFFRDPQYRQIP